MRLIDADELVNNLVCLKQDLEDCGYKHKRIEGVDDCVEEIRCTESVDAIPVIHASWVEDDYGFNHCNICGWEWDTPETESAYCPNCGAKMDS